ncbi:hypothetical protein [Paenibacillus sp. GM2FR]|uniref:hypothetical protein n=1 Tax=Paenibacillus sp. GM2FR TaxID=2059268 RepID=UPI00105468B5|nr:hypothetical protein [Paenibacillus sp. GM2FR]
MQLHTSDTAMLPCRYAANAAVPATQRCYRAAMLPTQPYRLHSDATLQLCWRRGGTGDAAMHKKGVIPQDLRS